MKINVDVDLSAFGTIKNLAPQRLPRCIFFVHIRNVKLTKSLSKSAEIEQKLPLYWCVFAFQKTDRNVVKSLSLYLDNLIMCIFISFILIEIIGGI